MFDAASVKLHVTSNGEYVVGISHTLNKIKKNIPMKGENSKVLHSNVHCRTLEIFIDLSV